MTDQPNPARASIRRTLLKRWFVLWPLTVGLILYPINNLPLRLSFLIAVAALWIGLLYFCWSCRIVRKVLLSITGLMAMLLFFPGRDYDATTLRQRYVATLLNYEGTRYIWGGENGLGIDCSGLIRRGIIMANYRQGIVTCNPRLVREGISLWWNDCSAQALGDEYRQRTRHLVSAPSINELDHSKILPGDIAVMESGVRTMAYLGERLWIEADPHAAKVIKIQAPNDSPWFHQPVKIMRWSQLKLPENAPVR
jgi:hypothetical protein